MLLFISITASSYIVDRVAVFVVLLDDIHFCQQNLATLTDRKQTLLRRHGVDGGRGFIDYVEECNSCASPAECSFKLEGKATDRRPF